MFEWLDDEEEGGDEHDDADDEEDDSDAAVEATFREQRAIVRESRDLGDLRRMRRNLQDAIAGDLLEGVAAARGRDLIELIDDRVAELRSRQLAGGAR